jgi:hypothetical protein
VPGAEEQTNAKAALKLRDRFRNRRLADAKLPRRAEKKEPVSQYGGAHQRNWETNLPRRKPSRNQ